MTTITHTPDGPRFDGMTLAELADAAHDEAERLWNKREFQETSCVLALAAAALRHLSEWQPIETQIVPGQAPWDGKEYLVCGVNPDGEKFQAIGHWWSEDEDWHQEAIGEEVPDMHLYRPTHYRPLSPGPGAAP
jgi:hypothetical protein